MKYYKLSSESYLSVSQFLLNRNVPNTNLCAIHENKSVYLNDLT